MGRGPGVGAMRLVFDNSPMSEQDYRQNRSSSKKEGGKERKKSESTPVP